MNHFNISYRIFIVLYLKTYNIEVHTLQKSRKRNYISTKKVACIYKYKIKYENFYIILKILI